MYFSEVDKIWLISRVEERLNSMPNESFKKELFNNDLPSDSWHGGKWIKFDTDGTEVWRTQLGTTSSDSSLGIATDSHNNVYITGYTYGDLDGDNLGASDAVVVKSPT